MNILVTYKGLKNPISSYFEATHRQNCTNFFIRLAYGLWAVQRLDIWPRKRNKIIKMKKNETRGPWALSICL